MHRRAALSRAAQWPEGAAARLRIRLLWALPAAIDCISSGDTERDEVTVEDFAEMTRGDQCDFTQVEVAARKARHRGDAFIGDAARHDHLEVPQVRLDVQGEAVAGHPARDAHADGGDLFVADPHAGKPLDAPARNPILGDRTDQHLFDVAHVAVHVTAIRLEVDDRVADQLARPVIGHVAAAPCLMDFDGVCCALRFVCEDVRRVGAASEREDVRVFEQQQLLVAFAAAQALDGLLLQAQAVGVTRQSEPAGFADAARLDGLIGCRLHHLRF